MDFFAGIQTTAPWLARKLRQQARLLAEASFLGVALHGGQRFGPGNRLLDQAEALRGRETAVALRLFSGKLES